MVMIDDNCNITSAVMDWNNDYDKVSFFCFLCCSCLVGVIVCFPRKLPFPLNLNCPCAGEEVESVVLFDLEYRGVAHDREFHRSDNHFHSTELSEEATRA